MLECKRRNCFHIVLALISSTLFIYFVAEFYLSEFPKSIEFRSTPLPDNFSMKKDENEQKYTRKIEDKVLVVILAEMNARGQKISKNYDPVNCGLVLRNDILYIGRHRARHPILHYKDPKILEMGCEAIAERNNFSQRENNEQQLFPIAFARNVFKDYRFLEMELLANYSAQNWYCFSVDAKAKPKFKRRIRQLASCFPNVLVAKKEFPMDSSGHRTSDALMECAKELGGGERRWKYLITLQNFDIQIKSNSEMAEILASLNGANDIELEEKPSEFTVRRLNFYKKNYKWNLGKLNIFKNNALGQYKASSVLRLGKGSMCASLSREFVDYILKNLDLRILLEQFNGSEFGVDEHLFQSLAATPQLFPRKGNIQRVNGENITRYVLWNWDAEEGKGRCRSGIRRHALCIFGLPDLAPHFLDNKYLFANKMMPEADMEAIYCWHKEMRMRNGN